MILQAILSASRAHLRSLAAIIMAALALSCGFAAVAADDPLADPSPAQYTASCVQPPMVRPLGNDVWGAQDALVDRTLSQLPAGARDRPNIYTVAVAPLGTQTLFSREAKVALDKLAGKYGGMARCGILLSNGAVDMMKVPLATQQNIATVLAAIGRRTEASPDDVLIVYLTSHGAPQAYLSSALPGNVPILAISADSMAAALDEAHIRKRVIIISACFSGSWIPRLANDDTIIMTAAAADRTSFGCADNRPLTYFGEAFLTGPLARGASLADSFEGARKTVTQWEQEQKLLFSNPQIYVGKNMQKFWMDGPARTSPARVATRR